jgi:hypothetical protein
MIRRLIATTCMPLAALTFLAGCKTINKMAHAVPVPKLSSVTKIIPGMGGPDDPEVPFDVRGQLAYGHTVRVEVYDGARVATKLFAGTVMVNQEGIVEFPDVGSVKIGGRTPLEARGMIESLFRSAGRAASRTHVHMVSIEGNPLVAIEGEVVRPAILLLTKGMTTSSAMLQAGGRPEGSMARAVYITHEGGQKFFINEVRADNAYKLAAGDIITLSPDL